MVIFTGVVEVNDTAELCVCWYVQLLPDVIEVNIILQSRP
jgi:hypothetical protein